MTTSIPSNYYSLLATAESSNNPNASNPNSSASGLYQFTKGTWQSLGYNVSDIFNPVLQNQAIQTLTNQNAQTLTNAGIPLTNSNLYAAHFLGAGTATNILDPSIDPSTPLSSLVSNSVITANPQIAGMSVSQFQTWLSGRIGGTANPHRPVLPHQA